MSKVDQATLSEFGIAVERETALKGWTLDELASAMGGACGKSMLSKIINGKRPAISARIVGKLIAALDLEKQWVEPFLNQIDAEQGAETKAEHDADRIIGRLMREGATKGLSESLIILLADTHANGGYSDLQTAFVAAKTALEAAGRINERGDMPPDNTGSQLNAIMAEVAKLNNKGALDEADALLDQEDRRMREMHKAERDRQEQQAKALLAQRIDQDRLRNRPDMAAKRLINSLRQAPQPGKLFWAIDTKAGEWRDQGNHIGDIFALHTALELAKANFERAKNKSELAASALFTLGWCHLRLAERSRNDKHLTVAHNAFKAALKKTSKSIAPLNWTDYQDGLGLTLRLMGQRDGDIDLLQSAVECYRVALKIDIRLESDGRRIGWCNLGISLQALGELTRDPAPLGEAVTALETALALEDRGADGIDWQITQNNLALALRWLGDVTDNLAVLTRAHQGYAACEALEYRKEAPFEWAKLQWNIADLALARHRLDPDPALLTEARTHVTAARAFFVDGSDHQTQRCDELLAKINQAEA